MGRPVGKGVTWAFALFLILAVAIGAVVTQRAQQAVLESRSGSVSEVILDPTAPGFRAFTEATTAVLVVHTAPDSGGVEMTGATILTPADADIGGTVITVQSTFRGQDSSAVLRETFQDGGLEAVANALAEVVGTGFTSVVALDGEGWASLIGDDLPLNLTVRADLVEGEGDARLVVVPEGTRGFTGEEIAEIVNHQNPSEPTLGLALRHQEVWRAWISQTASVGERPEVVELDGRLGEVLGALERGEVSFRTIPTVTRARNRPENTTYFADEDGIAELFAQIVPFPTEVMPGDRPAVLLLDSTGGEVASEPFVEAITLGGGRVTVLGNSTGEPELVNRVQVHDQVATEVANDIRSQLGPTEIDQVPLEDATTAITVIIGVPLAGS